MEGAERRGCGTFLESEGFRGCEKERERERAAKADTMGEMLRRCGQDSGEALSESEGVYWIPLGRHSSPPAGGTT